MGKIYVIILVIVVIDGTKIVMDDSQTRHWEASEKDRWCRRGDLNPHGGYPPPPQDGVSTNSTTSA